MRRSGGYVPKRLKDSAEIAKDRLWWCVAQRRNGGSWVPVSWEIMKITTFTGVTFEVMTRIKRLRWRYT